MKRNIKVIKAKVLTKAAQRTLKGGGATTQDQAEIYIVDVEQG